LFYLDNSGKLSDRNDFTACAVLIWGLRNHKPVVSQGRGGMKNPMRICKSSLLILGAALCMGGALPAAAAVHQLGAVNVSADHYTQVSWTRFDGPVERLSFVPDNDAVDCDHITINYKDGTSHDVFSGVLLKDQRQTITFPQSDSRLRSVDFACKARSLDGARISLSAVTEGDRDLYPDTEPHMERQAHVRTFENANPQP
jgi:hypothetical protein